MDVIFFGATSTYSELDFEDGKLDHDDLDEEDEEGEPSG